MSSRPKEDSKGDVSSGRTSVAMNREAVGCLWFLYKETELRPVLETLISTSRFEEPKNRSKK